MRRFSFFFFAIIICLISNTGEPCTTAIISGKITPDGRPLLWKNRDTDNLNNKLMYFREGNLDYIGLVNSNDSNGNEIWIGMNNAGFAIMNSVAANLGLYDTVKYKDKEGIIMKLALRECTTVDDFEKLLNTLNKPFGVETNFGVIDAYGNAAYFETHHWGYVKFDVNESPDGYLIRTNFAFSGVEDKGQGYERYLIEEELFKDAYNKGNLTLQFILQDAARCLKHGLTKVDLKKQCSFNPDDDIFVNFADFIPRYSTSASVVIQGVRKGDNPDKMIMWTILGFPPCSVVYPVFFNEEKLLPSILSAESGNNAWLCSKVLEVKDKCFPIKRGRGTNYIKINVLYNLSGSGIMQRLMILENEILRNSEEFINDYFKTGLSIDLLKKYYNSNDEKIINYFNNLLK